MSLTTPRHLSPVIAATLWIASSATAAPLQIDSPWNTTGANTGTVEAVPVTATSAGNMWGGSFNDENPSYSDASLFGSLALPPGTLGDAFNLQYAQAPGGPVDLVTITLGGALQDPIFYIWDIDNIDANVTVSPGGSVFTSNAEAFWNGDTLTSTGRIRGGFGAVQYLGLFPSGSEFTFLFDFDQDRMDSFTELVAVGIAVIPEPSTAVLVLAGIATLGALRRRSG